MLHMQEDKGHARFIASRDLRSRDVPPPGANLEALEAFCLTLDGYEGGRYSIDDLMCEAEHVERDGLEIATLEELRAAAFVRQRQYRWSTDQGQADEPLARKIRVLVNEIRRRVRA